MPWVVKRTDDGRYMRLRDLPWSWMGGGTRVWVARVSAATEFDTQDRAAAHAYNSPLGCIVIVDLVEELLTVGARD